LLLNLQPRVYPETSGWLLIFNSFRVITAKRYNQKFSKSVALPAPKSRWARFVEKDVIEY
jgi:hypothetical protein